MNRLRFSPGWFRAVTTAALLALTALVTAQAQEQTAPASAADRTTPAEVEPTSLVRNKQAWLYNPRERTRSAIRALEQEQPEAAIEAAAVARDIDSDDPAGAFNLGTVRLLAGDGGGAAEDLTPVAESDSPLATDAAYNLGSARYQQQQFDDAIGWYEETLRRDPSRVDAKINLELALQQRQQQEQEQDDAEEQQEPQDQQPSPQDEKQSEDAAQPPEPSPGQEQQQEDPSPGDQQPSGQRQGEEESPLPQFEPRPDMTAEEAASLLEAVEAMEREARQDMQPEARQAAPGNRDW